MQTVIWILLIAGGFCLRSIYFSGLIVAWRTGKDVCKAGSDGNPGAANAFLLCGPKWGIVCFLLAQDYKRSQKCPFSKGVTIKSLTFRSYFQFA